MHLRRLFWIMPLLLISIGISGTATVIAQVNCPDLVRRALLAVNENCVNVDRNAACYGYNMVKAGFVDDVSGDFFSSPSDRAEVVLLETLGTSPMDVEREIWGVAMMNLQANIPNAIPGQNVKFILIGDTVIENDVEPGDVRPSVDPLDAMTMTRLNVRSGASTNFNVLGIVEAGITLQADGLSPDENWLRVVYNGAIGWVAREWITGDGLDDLPVLDSSTRAPMQAFYLRTGVGAPECDEAPQDALLVQGPDAITVEMTINGADINLSSTMAVRVVPGETEAEDVLEITAVSGSVEVEGVTVDAGEKTTLCLAPAINDGLDRVSNDRVVDCAPSTPQPLELAEQQSWCNLGLLNTTLMNYQVPVDCEEGFVPRERPSTQAVESVQSSVPGETSSGTSYVDCQGFVPTSPLGQIGEGVSDFYWDAPASADLISYYVLTVNTSTGPKTMQTTATTAKVSGLQMLDTITWRVDAYRDDEVVCSVDGVLSQVVGVPESQSAPSAPPTAVPPPMPVPSTPSPSTPPGYAANWTCAGSSNYLISINWSGANPGDTISATITDTIGNSYAGSGTGVNGTFGVAVGYDFLNTIEITHINSGTVDTYVLPSGTLCKPIPVAMTSAACAGSGTVQIVYTNAIPGQVLETQLVEFLSGTVYTDSRVATVQSGSFTMSVPPTSLLITLNIAVPIVGENASYLFLPNLGPCL